MEFKKKSPLKRGDFVVFEMALGRLSIYIDNYKDTEMDRLALSRVTDLF